MREIHNLTLAELADYLDGTKQLNRAEELRLENDRRRGAWVLLERYRQRRLREQAEDARLHKMIMEEKVFWDQGIVHVAGVDEAGRGPLAGPVVAAAVILPPGTVINGLNDSKQLTPESRAGLFEIIRQTALGVGVGASPVEAIDRLNIYGALMQAMREALAALPVEPGMVLVDGFPIRGLSLAQKAIKGGDALSLSIAAASVIAKVTRDRMMIALHDRFPAYGFDRHKGYATAEHCRALNRWGPCPEHRRTFRLDFSEPAAEKRP
ncbi:MAG: ribonuclease HII [Bacillota bacterium]